MNIIVVGAGVVGSAVAAQLSEEGHNVAVIDRNRRVLREIGDAMDVLTVQGDGALPSVLEEAGIKAADMVIAVTSVDAVNLVVGMLAYAYDTKHRIVRIRNREYVRSDCVISLKALGIEQVVNPEPFIVESLLRMIQLPGSYDYAALAGGQVQMFGFHVAENSPALGRTLRELRELGDLNAFLILYITRDGEVIVPGGDDTIQAGDSVHLLVSSGTVEFLLPVVHPKPDATEHVIIVGGSRIGVELAEALEGHVRYIALIEPDEAVAEETAARLKKTVVLNGDPTDLRVLEEAALDRCDLFCALSDDDQNNMLASLLAKKHGAAHTGVLVHQPEYVSVLDSLGVDIVINPRLAIVGAILQHVRHGHILSVTRLAEGEGEIIELQVPADCPAVKGPLKDLKFPANALVGAVVSNGDMMIPTGDTKIAPGDLVLVYTLPDARQRIEKLFARR